MTMRTGWIASVPRAAVGIFAHNEEATIQFVVEGFLGQRVSSASLTDVVVVCCGCTDDTVDLVKEIATKDSRVRLLVRPRREGKIAAINEFLGVVDADVLVFSSGDVVPGVDAVDRLVSRLVEDGRCMMTGPRVLMAERWVPRRLVDHLHDTLWALHHTVSLQRPKLGEVVAVRRASLPPQLPPGVHCDEALMESIVIDQGGSVGYVADALVYNSAPTCMRALYQQRRRIAAQHFTLRRLRGYQPSTMRLRLVLAALRTLPLRGLPPALVLAVLETAARTQGYLDARRGRSYPLWRINRPPSRADHYGLETGTYRPGVLSGAADERCT